MSTTRPKTQPADGPTAKPANITTARKPGLALSAKGARVFKKVPAAVNMLGAALVITQIIVGINLLTRSDAKPPVLPPPAPPAVQMEPVPEPPAPPPIAEPPARPAKPELPVTRIPEGKVVALPQFPGTGSPVIGQVRDRKARLTFAELGKPWNPSEPPDNGPITDGRYSMRQTFVTEEFGPDLDHKWWADIDSQRLWSDIDPGDSLYDAAAAMLDYKQNNNFPASTKGVDVASQPVKSGWLLAREMRMPKSAEGRKARVELAVTIAVDTGADRPSVLWITIPDTHRHLWPDIRRVAASLRVLK